MTDASNMPKPTTRKLDSTTRAWLILIVLSLASALATLDGLPKKVAGLVILGLALAKSWVILARYLGLYEAPGWLRGMFLVICFWAAIVGSLYLI